MAFIVIYDADVLYPNTLRDLLIRIAQQPHLVQAKWTDRILDEMLRALRRNRSEITEEKADRLRELINGAVRDCLVTGYEPLIDCADLRKRTSLTSGTALGGRCGYTFARVGTLCPSRRTADYPGPRHPNFRASGSVRPEPGRPPLRDNGRCIWVRSPVSGGSRADDLPVTGRRGQACLT